MRIGEKLENQPETQSAFLKFAERFLKADAGEAADVCFNGLQKR